MRRLKRQPAPHIAKRQVETVVVTGLLAAATGAHALPVLTCVVDTQPVPDCAN